MEFHSIEIHMEFKKAGEAKDFFAFSDFCVHKKVQRFHMTFSSFAVRLIIKQLNKTNQ